ncbi:hypothetical protein K435DRAFT_212244 [Dendrothele bispora CBS 962.96]|uniref:Uncharacterized protein n=1 Tax=Dendrothele bispora (strain CBS 962.96) TaxID=1314807 RepID=A0A4S8MN20_DENBC|nr:hypothetical protein K435DRAFT_212244 [Dendrothele bispora CBS 962.96]
MFFMSLRLYFYLFLVTRLSNELCTNDGPRPHTSCIDIIRSLGHPSYMVAPSQCMKTVGEANRKSGMRYFLVSLALRDMVITPSKFAALTAPPCSWGCQQKQFEDGTGRLGDLDPSVGLLEPGAWVRFYSCFIIRCRQSRLPCHISHSLLNCACEVSLGLIHICGIALGEECHVFC